MSGLHREAGHVVELDRRAVVVGLLALAARLEKTTGLVFPVWTLAVYFFSVSELRPPVRIQLRQRTLQKIVGDHPDEVHRVRRAAGNLGSTVIGKRYKE
jgi:hypothetical protein